MYQDEFRIELQPLGTTFAAPAGATLLEAAEFAGVQLPSSCRNGTCRTCLSHATSGAVRYEIEWPGVSVDEKREGWFLPCVAHATSDMTIVNSAAAPAV